MLDEQVAPPQIADMPGASGVMEVYDEFARSQVPPPSRKWRHALLLALFSAVYLLVTLRLSSKHLLTHDELFTVHVSHFSSLDDLCSMLARFEPHPPLTYLLTRASEEVLSANPLAWRLPAVCGFLVMLLCWYRFSTQWVGSTYAAIAMLVPLGSVLYIHAYNARPYGLLVGASALAMLGWQMATEGRQRRLGLVALWLGLMLAICSHYYAVLMFLPLAAGELARTVHRKRLDWEIWAAIALGYLPLFGFLPLALAYKNFPDVHEGVRWSAIGTSYSELLARLLAPVLLAAVLIAGIRRLGLCRVLESGSGAMPTALGGHVVGQVAVQNNSHVAGTHAHAEPWAWHPILTLCVNKVLGLKSAEPLQGPAPSPPAPLPPEYRGRGEEDSLPPVHQVVAVAVLCLLPVCGVILGKTATGAFDVPYALPALMGLSLAVAVALRYLAASSETTGQVLVGLFAGWFLLTGWWTDRAIATEQQKFDAAMEFLEKSGDGSGLIAISEHTLFARLAARAPASLSSRLVYLSSSEECLSNMSFNAQERELQELAKRAGWQVLPFEAFTETPREFLVFGQKKWLTGALLKRGATLQMVGANGDRLLFRASTKAPPPF